MLRQLILTMRSDFAARYKRDVAVLDGGTLLKGFRTARLIGDTGYSMRVTVEQHEARALTRALEDRFVVEPDHVLHTFGKRPVRRLSLGRRVARRASATLRA